LADSRSFVLKILVSWRTNAINLNDLLLPCFPGVVDQAMILPRTIDREFLMRFGARMERGSDGPADQLLGKHFSIALTNELQLLGLNPTSIAIRAGAFNEKLKTGGTRTHIRVRVSATIPHATQGQFIDATLAAKTKCLTQVGPLNKISIDAHLETLPLG
jgi:hypothetical protein